MQRDKKFDDWDRINILLILVFVFFAVFTYQFFSKSVLAHEECKKLASNQYIIEKKLPSSRGIIYAKDKHYPGGYYPLVINEEKYEINIVPKNVIDKRAVAQKVAPILELNEDELFEKINNDKPYIPPVKKGVSKEIADKIIALDIQGIMIVSNENRHYTEGNLASQVLGFVDAENVGRYGIEGYYDEKLKGQSGEVTGEKDILGRLISVGDKVDPKNGDDIYLTIDRNAQYEVQKVLAQAIKENEAESGKAIVLDSKTGEVIAMAANPDFNPNEYAKTAQEHADYFTNPNISSIWEPGSIMKPLVMAMAMDMDKLTPETENSFGGSVTVQGFTITNARYDAFGKENMTQVLLNSDNVAMVWISEKMENEQMFDYFNKYGFNGATGIDLQGELTTTLPDLGLWRQIHKATMAFGQGVSVTPIQMAAAYGALANDGNITNPRIVEKMIDADGNISFEEKKEVRPVLKKETSVKLRTMLTEIIEKSQIKTAGVEGYKVAGKTGTAQIPKKDGQGYEKDIYIHSLAGFFPADDPQFIMLMILDKPKKYTFASNSVAPYYGKIAQWLLNYYQVLPNQIKTN